jgi:hypothetical protein
MLPASSLPAYTATYSPDDNKLRLYSAGRLPEDVYRRVRAAGFIYAPRQELFVAPGWTPEREDLLLELCGEIGDEDTSLLERAEERAERFGDYSENRARDAQGAAENVRRIADGIPFGQPILVGHHSERHARKDAERIERGMRQAVKMWETSEYWTNRAAGAVRHAKYVERPDVRSRRIKKLESERRKMAARVERSEKLRAIWSGLWEKLKEDTPENRRRAAVHFANLDGAYYAREYTHPSGYVGPLSLWEAAGGADEHAPAIAAPEEVQAKAIRNHDAYLPTGRRWLAHYDNRLSYERAMLADAGGTVAERTGPEKGGACKCWASPRGGWSYIVKVNKVSVTVLDNWGNGGNSFTRTIPLDKLAAVMTKAEVEQARTDGRLVELAPDGLGKVEGFVLLETAPEPTTSDGPSACRSWKEPNVPAEAVPAVAEVVPAPELTRSDVDAMRASLKAGVAVVSAPQLFPTPAALARRMAALADIPPGARVLEPSAGTGNLLAAILEEYGPTDLVAVETHHALAKSLRSYGFADVRCADFLTCNGDLGTFDRIVMNPPFTNGADVRHILHARHMLRPGGRLVALCANGPRQRDALLPLADSWEDLPDGSFSEAGTNVRVALLTLSPDD